jgi:CRP-like cAMP-binding protein
MTAMTGAPKARPADLRALPLFDDCDDRALQEAATALDAMHVPAGQALMHETSGGHELVIVRQGSLAVTRRGHTDGPLAVIGDGGFVGELSLLRGTPRSATVVAVTPSDLLVCAERDFGMLLRLPGVAQKLAATGARRETVNRASGSAPVEVVPRAGSPVALRPILPTDAPAMVAGLDRLSATSRYRRFLSASLPTESMITALADVNYPEHFAWVVLDSSAVGEPIVAVGRFVRLAEGRGTAEIALTVADGHQSRGIGAVLMDALALAALEAGFSRFSALVLAENEPMLKLLRRSGATLVRSAEANALEASLVVPDRSLTLTAREDDELRGVVRHVLGDRRAA